MSKALQSSLMVLLMVFAVSGAVGCGPSPVPGGSTVASQTSAPQSGGPLALSGSLMTTDALALDSSSFGGSGVLIRLQAEQTAVSFACAAGVIPVAIDPAQGGSFDVDGTFRSRSGPIPVGGNPTLPAHYIGTVQNGRVQMTVSYTSTDGQAVQQAYEASQGQPASFNQACPL